MTPADPVRTAETVTPGYVLCYECDGEGRCPRCHGEGWLDNAGKKRKCPLCHAQRPALPRISNTTGNHDGDAVRLATDTEVRNLVI
ncbi:hypothetical protein, partial [Nocardia sp. NPDC004722]